MPHSLQVFRYIVTGVFIACNAIVASAAVWNLNIVQAFELHLSSLKRIDSYLIFLGASSLVIIFPITFIELLAYNTLVDRVWFEIIRVGLYLLLNLGGAIALTVVFQSQICSDKDGLSSSTELLPRSLCVSTEVLQAFTWICALVHIIYFSILLTSVLLRQRKEHTIWHNSMRRFPWSDALRPFENAPKLREPEFHEILPQNTGPLIGAPPKLEIPVPRRIQHTIHQYQSSPGHDFEHYALQNGNALELHLPPRPPPGASIINPMSFYPQYLQSAAPQRQAPFEGQIGPLLADTPDPSPLGDWPRLDPPLRTKRPDHRSPHTHQRDKVLRTGDGEGPSRPRPSGPRNRPAPGIVFSE